MLTKTLDIVVREKLMDLHLPMHYYLPFLHYAIKCVESLSMDFDLGTNVKEVRLTPTSYDRVSIPSDASDIISVFGLYGGQKKVFHRNTALTKVYNLDGATKIPYGEDATTIPDYSDFNSSISTTEEQFITIYHPNDDYKYEYNIDLENAEIILKPGHDLTYVYVSYRTDSISTSNANTVEPYVVPVIHAYMEYRDAIANKSAQSLIIRLREEYYAAKRGLRARKNPMTIQELSNIMTR